jgi:hypothetical protein
MSMAGSLRSARTALSKVSSDCISSAQCTARSVSSGWATGAPQKAMIASPMNLSSVPP